MSKGVSDKTWKNWRCVLGLDSSFRRGSRKAVELNGLPSLSECVSVCMCVCAFLPLFLSPAFKHLSWQVYLARGGAYQMCKGIFHPTGREQKTDNPLYPTSVVYRQQWLHGYTAQMNAQCRVWCFEMSVRLGGKLNNTLVPPVRSSLLGGLKIQEQI